MNSQLHHEAGPDDGPIRDAFIDSLNDCRTKGRSPTAACYKVKGEDSEPTMFVDNRPIPVTTIGEDAAVACLRWLQESLGGDATPQGTLYCSSAPEGFAREMIEQLRIEEVVVFDGLSKPKDVDKLRTLKLDGERRPWSGRRRLRIMNNLDLREIYRKTVEGS